MSGWLLDLIKCEWSFGTPSGVDTAAGHKPHGRVARQPFGVVGVLIPRQATIHTHTHSDANRAFQTPKRSEGGPLRLAARRTALHYAIDGPPGPEKEGLA